MIQEKIKKCLSDGTKLALSDLVENPTIVDLESDEMDRLKFILNGIGKNNSTEKI